MSHGRPWLPSVLLALDQLANALLHGWPTQTISARAAEARDRGRWWGRWLCGALDRVDPGHCDRARDRWRRLRAADQA